MTLKELEVALVKAGTPRNTYCLTGGLANEASCIERTPISWQVYYSERGERTSVKNFASEQEACDLFSKRVTNS